ncbi:ATP-binding protein [Metabacillus fastidiosus]|uniref:histidine kinase n=1 Tax=Metabacillus fastidiosus TaxID=1458 RepID=A0ABU6P073_9BACI|nr:ATP-binding protein [Metabacillus fastidiosus]MED4402373.1 ATP-binding protein [Metabacillus fastidiosus]MED4462245.1 ATP-binding protein [Metabacillus fastidiosus]
MFETLLLNFLFLIFPIIVFLIFFEHRQRNYHKIIFIFLAIVTMILCMTFPIELNIGFIFDLRYIPFVIVALFLGYRKAFPLYIVLNIYRFYLGGDGVLQSFIFSTIIFMLIPLMSRKFIQLSSRNRVLFAALASFLTMGFYLLTLTFFFDKLNREFWILTCHALTTYTGMTIILMILIEKIGINIKKSERFLHSERLNVVSELAASVSHEIRNPLTVTSGFLQILNKSTTVNPEEKRYIEIALQELKRAEQIVSDYLSLAKPQSENMVYSNFETEMEYTKNLIIPYATMHQVDVQYYFNNSLNTKYDKNQIQQCLINLYKNAIEAMKGKGGTLSLDVSEKKKTIVIKIKDTGVGMTKEEISRLGKPYYSTKEEGTGLGMLVVYSAIDKIKGKIEVKSEKGKGTTFVITIPA